MKLRLKALRKRGNTIAAPKRRLAGLKTRIGGLGARYRLVADAVSQRVRDRMATLRLNGRARLSFVRQICGNPRIAGAYRRGMIILAYASRQCPVETLNHEAIHAFRDLGLFQVDEWEALERDAIADGDLMSAIDRRYPHLNHHERTEEAIAERFRVWAGQRSAIAAAVGRIVECWKWVSSLGGLTSEEVMRRIERGEVGARAL